MAQVKLTLEEARKNPASFLYVFASKEFLQYIDAKHRRVILGKRGNQQLILYNSAKAYLGSYDDANYQQYVDAIRAGFNDIYGMEPETALNKLALGESVCGKNWDEGVYGVGAVGDKSFKGTDISVNPDNGYMMRDGKYLPVYDTVVDEKRGNKSGVYQQFYYDEATGNTYMSQYSKTMKKFYAWTYTTKDGNKYSAKGNAVKSDQAGSIWENINFDWNTLLDWIASILNTILGTNIPLSTETSLKNINASNTLPSQTEDGFTIEAGMGEAAGIALLAVAAGTLLAGGLKKPKKTK